MFFERNVTRGCHMSLESHCKRHRSRSWRLFFSEKPFAHYFPLKNLLHIIFFWKAFWTQQILMEFGLIGTQPVDLIILEWLFHRERLTPPPHLQFQEGRFENGNAYRIFRKRIFKETIFEEKKVMHTEWMKRHGPAVYFPKPIYSLPIFGPKNICLLFIVGERELVLV